MAEPLRITGNIVGIAVARIVWFGLAMLFVPHILGSAAMLVVIFNVIHAARHGYFAAEHAYFITTLVFIGIALFCCFAGHRLSLRRMLINAFITAGGLLLPS